MAIFEKLKFAFLAILFVLSCGYLLNLAYLESLKYKDPPEYLTGFLVFEDHLKCGILQTRKLDRMSCRFNGEICSELRDYPNRRIRILGKMSECGPGADFRCARNTDFVLPEFIPERCYTDYLLVKVFDAPDESGAD